MNLTEFFDTIVGGRVELRAIKQKGIALGRLFGGDYQGFVDKFNGKANLYFGVLPRTNPNTCGVLWTDIDFKTSDEATARALLSEFRPTPHIVVATGGGLHVYWLIDPPIPINHVKPIMKAIAAKIGGDPASTDPARILRIPGTLNIKYDPPREATIESVASSLLPYHPDDFGLEISEEEIKSYEVPQGYERSAASFSKAISIVQDASQAIEGQGGDQTTYELCAKLVRDQGLTIDEAFDILQPWNAKNNPPWDDGDLRAKLENAVRYGKGKIGGEDPVEDFKGVEPESAPTSDAYAEMDERFHVVDYNGQIRIYAKGEDELGKKWQDWTVSSFTEMATGVLGYGMVKVKGRGTLPKARLWFEDKRPNKKTYMNCVFDPSNSQSEKTFNTWTGLIDPVEGDWSKLEELIFDILATKDQKVYDYIMNWCALSVQRPWVKPQTTLIFRGIEGNGKSLFGQMFIDLFGRHGTRIDNPEHVIGRFNEHLMDKVAIFVDEAYWSRDRKHEGIIKSLITDTFTQYEGKFKPAVTGRSYTHVIMASNNEYVANISGIDSRRYAVFDVPYIKEKSWYASLAGDRKRIAAAWLHSLLLRDISGFEPANDRPKTEAYYEQMGLSHEPILAWLHEFVSEGYYDPRISPVAVIPAGRVFRCSDIREIVLGFMKQTSERIHERGTSTYIGRKLRKYLPTLSLRKVLIDEKPEPCYLFPSLEEARMKLNVEEFPELNEINDLI